MMVGNSKEGGSGDECSCFLHCRRLYVEVSTQANRGRALEPDGNGSTRAYKYNIYNTPLAPPLKLEGGGSAVQPSPSNCTAQARGKCKRKDQR